jgi:hypothetical protein
MPFRFRRKRLLLLLTFIVIYLIYHYYYFESLITEENDVKRSLSVPVVHEQFVEIDGKKLRKIDWHDYASIARTGI